MKHLDKYDRRLWYHDAINNNHNIDTVVRTCILTAQRLVFDFIVDGRIVFYNCGVYMAFARLQNNNHLSRMGVAFPERTPRERFRKET